MPKKGLLVVDVQRDFCEGGALAVPNASQIVPIINAYLRSGEFDYVVATADCHPLDHISFARVHHQKPFTYKIIQGKIFQLWPDHCVVGSSGALFHPDLLVDLVDLVFEKGTASACEGYSAFFYGTPEMPTGLYEKIVPLGISSWMIVGLATDYCVHYTAMDARKLGLEVRIDLSACAAIDPSCIELLKKKWTTSGITWTENMNVQL